MNELYNEVKQLIIDSLNLEDISIDDIETEASLFVDGLGLDSIDALELGMAIKQKYGITLSADNEEMKKCFFSVKTLADFINENK
jgi:acyl carrier protein